MATIPGAVLTAQVALLQGAAVQGRTLVAGAQLLAGEIGFGVFDEPQRTQVLVAKPPRIGDPV